MEGYRNDNARSGEQAPATRQTGAAQLVLTPADVDSVELLLGGFSTPQRVGMALKEEALARTDGTSRVPVAADGLPHGGSERSRWVELLDAENTPIASVLVASEAIDGAHEVTRIEPRRSLATIAGLVADTRLRDARHAAELASGGRLVVIVESLPTRADLAEVSATMGPPQVASGPPLWVVPVGRGTARHREQRAIVRAVQRLISAGQLSGTIMTMPYPDTSSDQLLTVRSDDPFAPQEVLRQLGATNVVTIGTLASNADPLRSALHRAYPEAVVSELLGAGGTPVAHRTPGYVVMFTGLSGSGKSTVAKAFAQRIEDRLQSRVAVIDGDEMRQVVSAGLGFDRASRDLNIARLGYIAAMVAQTGGISVMAPIAPFAAARADVRRRVEAVGAFMLVHVATPLAVCEARDRKGLYAKARAGLIPDFTGISSPYEAPEDADVMIDTTELSIDDAVDPVYAAFEEKMRSA